MADYPRSWNDDCPPITEAQKARHRVAERALPALIALFYAYVIASLLLQGGCIADEPSSGLDIPPGCQCVEPLEELDRRLRAVEGEPSTGTFVPPEWMEIVPEGATMEVKVAFRGGEWLLTWWITFVTGYEISASQSHIRSFGIPYPATNGTARLWTRVASSEPEWARAPWMVHGNDMDPLVDVTLEAGEEVKVAGAGWTFRMTLPPIPTSAMVTE